jgi:hypothetical protein
MATPAQINANRANAQKSTGPRSAEGKSASRFNALKHGIDAASVVIPGEDPADYDSLAAQYLHEYRPQSASESFHVDTMLRADWMKRRMQIVEADLYRTVIAESPGNPLAAVLLAESPAAKLLLRVQRQIAAFERTWHRANTELLRARAENAENAKDLDDSGKSFDRYLDHLCARPPISELASIRFPVGYDFSADAPSTESPDPSR